MRAIPNRTLVLLGLAQCVSLGSTVLEVIFSSFCEAIISLIIPKHRGHAFTFFRENLDLIASIKSTFVCPHWFNPLLRILFGHTAPPFPLNFFQSFEYCRRSSKASIIDPAKEIFDYIHANMIKLEKCSLIILTVFVRTSIKSYLICLFVVATEY